MNREHLVQPASSVPCQNLVFAILDTFGGYLDIMRACSEEIHAVAITKERGSMNLFWKGADDSQIQVQVVWA